MVSYPNVTFILLEILLLMIECYTISWLCACSKTLKSLMWRFNSFTLLRITNILIRLMILCIICWELDEKSNGILYSRFITKIFKFYAIDTKDELRVKRKKMKSTLRCSTTKWESIMIQWLVYSNIGMLMEFMVK